MPDVLTAFAEVDKYFTDFLEGDEIRLMEFIYRDGLTERSACQFVFADGTRSEVMMEDEAMAEPPATWVKIDRVTVRALDYDLRAFKDEQLGEACRRYGASRIGFLEARHRMVAKTLADDLGLAVEDPDDSLSPEVYAFALAMQRELNSNAHKGEPGSWIEVAPEILWNDLMYHAAKLVYAMKHNDPKAVREFSADVANMAMMTRDSWLAHRAPVKIPA